MRCLTIVVLLLLLGSAVRAQEPAKGTEVMPDRFGLRHKPLNFPQRTPKETLNSVIEAISSGQGGYLVAHLMEPDFVSTRIAERARILEPVVEGELVEMRNSQRQKASAFPQSQRLPDDPKAFRDVVLRAAIDRATGLVIADVQGRIANDPESTKLLRRFFREGMFADTETASRATLMDVKDHAVFFKKVGDRWFMENRITDEKPPAP